jgi:twinkle protein
MIGDDVKWQAELESDKCVVTVDELSDEIDDVYLHGGDDGEQTGWDRLSLLHRPMKGTLNIVGGHGSHGKSGFLDALLCNLSHSLNWNFLMFSAENQPYGREHAKKLIEIKAGKKLRGKVKGEDVLMPNDEYRAAKRWVGEHFSWIDIKEASHTIDKIMDVMIYNARKYDGFVLDPYNEIEHRRGKLSETDYISMILSLLRSFARTHNVLVWVVVHPAKTPRNRDGVFPVLNLVDLAGSYSWKAKADVGLICHREDITVDEMTLYVQKVRFKNTGRPGSITFSYDWDSGRFYDGKECGMEKEKGFKKQTECPF